MLENEEKSGLGWLVWFSFILLLVFDLFVWRQIIWGAASAEPQAYFLDVGQGDSELIVFPGDVKILTDAGPNSKVVGELEKITELSDKYIDLAVISHPQLDHFNGFRYLLDRYRVGAFVYNGRSDSPGVEEWGDLLNKIKARGIPLITLGAGDGIKNAESRIDFLSPDMNLVQSGELNDTGLVEMVKSSGLKILLAADIDSKIEKYLSERFDLTADILKVAHHGSKFSASADFINAVKPKAAIIEVGKNNYGHPAPETLKEFLSASVPLLRTDRNGLIAATLDSGKLRLFGEK